MKVVINDEGDLKKYLATFVTKIEDLKAFKYVDAGQDTEELIDAYFKNEYKGPVLFAGVVDDEIQIDQSFTLLRANVALTVLCKYIKSDSDSLTTVRDKALKILVKCLNKIADDNFDASCKGEKWICEFKEMKALPVVDTANSSCRGWYFELTIGWPAD